MSQFSATFGGGMADVIACATAARGNDKPALIELTADLACDPIRLYRFLAAVGCCISGMNDSVAILKGETDFVKHWQQMVMRFVASGAVR